MTHGSKPQIRRTRTNPCLKWALAGDYTIVLAEDRASALAAFRQERAAVVVLDLGLPPASGDTREGLATLADLLAENSLAKVIIITGQSDKGNALQAIGQGAFDFLCKPVELEELRVILKRGFYIARIEQRIPPVAEPPVARGGRV